jgi:hypothetical protein
MLVWLVLIVRSPLLRVVAMITHDETGSDLRHYYAQAARLREKLGEGLSFERVSIHKVSKGRLQTESSKQSGEKKEGVREKGTASAIAACVLSLFLVSSPVFCNVFSVQHHRNITKRYHSF